MSSTWIDMPVENAKEVAQRWIDFLFSPTVDFIDGPLIRETSTVIYEQDCEILLDVNRFNSIRDSDGYVYIGYLSVLVDNSLEDNLLLQMSTGNDAITTLDLQSNGSHLFTNVPVIFNSVQAGTIHSGTIFIGYKFKVI